MKTAPDISSSSATKFWVKAWLLRCTSDDLDLQTRAELLAGEWQKESRSWIKCRLPSPIQVDRVSALRTALSCCRGLVRWSSSFKRVDSCALGFSLALRLEQRVVGAPDLTH